MKYAESATKSVSPGLHCSRMSRACRNSVSSPLDRPWPIRICLMSASAAQRADANSAGSRSTRSGRKSAIAARMAGTRAPALSRVNTSPITMPAASSWRAAMARPMIAPTSAGSAVSPERNSHRAAAGPKPGGPKTSTSFPVSTRCSIQGTIGEKWPAPAVDAQMTRMYTSCRAIDPNPAQALV